MIDLDGKSIVITGGASGMGAAGVRLAANAGARVTIGDLNEEAGGELVAEVRAGGGQAQFVPADISNETDVRALVDAAEHEYGGLDGAWNNAGLPPLTSSSRGVFPLAEIPVDAMRRSLEVNVLGTFLCMKWEIDALLRGTGGAIVNTASTAGLIAIPASSDYIASKHAVIGLTKAAALDYADRGVRVNAVLPGIVRTPMLMAAVGDDPEALAAYSTATPIARLAEPEEIARAALWLLSDAASIVVGHSMVVDGGQTIV